MQKKFLHLMRDYMPIFHRDYITYIEEKYRDFPNTILNSNDDTLIGLYSDAISNLLDFRKVHSTVIHDYIIKESKKINIMKDNKSKQAHGNKGAGGTNPIKLTNAINNNTIAVLKKVSKIKNDTLIRNREYRSLQFKYLSYVLITVWCIWKLYISE